MTGASAAVPAAPTAREVTAGARATYAVFAGLGLAGSTWSSRLPEVRTQLNLDSASLGLLLLTIAVGGVIVLPLSGTVVTHIGPRRAVTVVALLVSASLGVISLGYALSASLLVAGLFLLGAATGFWDVAMTVHAAAVERQLGRPVMPRFFAAFSLGTVAGAAVGVLMTALRVPVSIHVAVVAAVIAGAVPAAARHFLPEHAARPIAVPPPVKMSRPGLGAWREPRTVAVGLVALAFAVAEGAGSNWVSVSVIDRHHVTATIGTLAYASFLTALTAGRWLGPAVLHRFGRVTVLRTAAAVTTTGVALFALGPSTGLAFAGSLLWGMGAALGFPVSMSAGADEPARAAGRVSIITSIGYCGFVGGPPLIGFLGNQTTVGHALLVITVLMTLSAVIAGTTRRSPDNRTQSGSDTQARTAVM
ncbi:MULTISPECIES: MFS transporter [unclassified Streptomyces]|uniref:MFS transporter n=1 Tax=unclassified Streptomyces TaxID=2593676 RepID=UPI0033B9CA70